MNLQPAVLFPPELLARAQHIRAAIFDVDGVLTDGRIYLSGQGEEFKAFHALDGHGLKLLLQVGIIPLIITGRDSAAIRKRVSDLGLPHAIYGAQDKLAAAQKLRQQLQLDWSALAAVGDDWPDLPLMQRAALACAPANAHAEVKAIAHYTTTVNGGHGAARQCCDLLLIATGHYSGLLQNQQHTLDGSC
jgi:3-deoxy-D-manno-octulosonate 8-phosphate phosphatase (KDO 8-P phosphatase)